MPFDVERVQKKRSLLEIGRFQPIFVEAFFAESLKSRFCIEEAGGRQEAGRRQEAGGGRQEEGGKRTQDGGRRTEEKESF